MENQYQIKNKFLNETTVKESYTAAWVRLINQFEEEKYGKVSYEKGANSSKTCYNTDGGKQHALATDEEVRT